ncbi:MAG: transporter suffix domain-containing protein [Vallitaleaceae bacterium]|nr:transporter suffix domain-containing protein [Vallitaleaceae bacterium]
MKNTRNIGIVFIVISFLLWGGIFVVSLLDFSNVMKVSIAGILAVAGEVFFWVGTVFAGKEIVKNFFKKIFTRKR